MNFRLAVKAVIIKDDKLLLIKRRPNDVHKPGAWDLPGGRLEIGEDPWEGIKRETKEETNLDVEPLLPFDLHHFTRDDGQLITMVFFLCKSLTQDVVLSEEHTEYKWQALASDNSAFPDWFGPFLRNIKKFKLVEHI